MKIKEGFELREVCGEYIVIAHGDKNIDFSKVINFNESAAVMWKAVATKEFTAEDMAQALLSTYEVEREDHSSWHKKEHSLQQKQQHSSS